MKEVRVEAAVGMVLAHDLTKIAPGEFKGRLFKKGHIIREADVPELLNIGKEHIYILELPEGRVHADEAAIRLAAALYPLATGRFCFPGGRDSRGRRGESRCPEGSFHGVNSLVVLPPGCGGQNDGARVQVHVFPDIFSETPLF